MPRLVGYKCENEECDFTDEDIFGDSEERPDVHPTMKCTECGGKMVKWDVKDNPHRVSIFDRGGM